MTRRHSAMAPHSDEWEHPIAPTYIDMDFLLPTGILIMQRCRREATLQEVKNYLWMEAKNYPLFELLGPPSTYIFRTVTRDAEIEEFYDETRRLCDLKMFHPMLKVIEPQGNRDEAIINTDIGASMGMSVNELNDVKDFEMITFRRCVLTCCQDAIAQRNSLHGDLSLAMYKHPPRLVPGTVVPEHVRTAVRKAHDAIAMCVWVVPADGSTRNKNKFNIKMQMGACPEDVVKEVIRKRCVVEGLLEDEMMAKCEEYKGTYVLRVCGLDEYLLEQCPIVFYKYIRTCVLEGTTPNLMLIHKKSDFLPKLVDVPFILPSYHRKGVSAMDAVERAETIDLWTIKDTIRLKLLHATYITLSEAGKLFVRVGLYHGTEPICEFKDSFPKESNKLRWNEDIDLDIQYYNLPRATKLCIGLCMVPMNRKRSKTSKPMTQCLYWGNINVFDFYNRMISDRNKIYMTPATSDDALNPLISPVSPEAETSNMACMEVEFENRGYPICFPNNQTINDHSFKSRPSTHTMSDEERQILTDIANRDSMSEITLQDRQLIWKHRDELITIPHILPKLISSTEWGCRDKVAEIYRLINEWPLLEEEHALELLDFSAADSRVREFAVVCLEEKLDDTRLSLYLLQLVQAIRFELYLDNPLTKFLLRRSILNQRIGHFFFWHLKSEMHTDVRMRFGLILEAYLRSCGDYLKCLSQQVEALDKLVKLTNDLKVHREDDQDRYLAEAMNRPDFLHVLQHMTSPLDHSNKLGKLVPGHCSVKHSKKRPMKITWTNDSPLANQFQKDFKILFKNGDDLRQDMLTLQIIRLMDYIWQEEGLDLRMIPYPVLATGNQVGMIQVVRKAETVMHIQKTKMSAAMQINTNQLHKWLKDNNRTQYDRAIDNFTRSCAGYAVATYILGIGDRHPDNIMVTDDGKLFHIDFGHFLNHKKSKFGYQRERVPFVLTDDLINTIARGKQNGLASNEFTKFQELCGKAFVSLRKHAALLHTLVSLMLNSGIPQLQTKQDINYMRQTLGVDSSEEQALLLFQTKFCEAYNGAWTTKLDWFFHWLKSKKS